jgi:CHAT domain-containing protein
MTLRIGNATYLCIVLCILLVSGSNRTTHACDGIPATDRIEAVAFVAQAESTMRMGHTNEALRIYARLDSSVLQGSSDHLLIAAIYNNIGTIYESQNRYQDALWYYEEGLKILDGADVPQVAIALAHIRATEKGYVGGGGSPVNPDLYTGRIGAFSEFMARDDAEISRDLTAILLLNAGNMYFQQSQLDQAGSLYQRVQLMDGSPLAWRAEANLAWLALEMKDYSKAENKLMSIIDSPELVDQTMRFRRAYLAIGVSHGARAEYEKASEYMQHALALYQEAEDVRGQGRTLAHLGTVAFGMRDLTTAIAYYEEALQVNAAHQDAETGWHATGGLAKCYQAQGDYEKASRFYAAYLDIVKRVGTYFNTDQGRVSFLENHNEIYKDYIRVEIEKARFSHNYQQVRKAVETFRDEGLRTLLQASRVVAVREAGHISIEDIRSTYRQAIAARDHFAGDPFPLLGWINAPDLETDRMSVAQMSPGVDTYMPTNRMFPGIPSPLAEPETIDFDSSLIPNVAFLEYFILPEQIAIFLKTPSDEVYGACVKVSDHLLKDLISKLGYALGVDQNNRVSATRQFIPKPVGPRRRHEFKFQEISKQLYQLLIAPLDAYLKQLKYDELVIVPHSILWQIPFTALLEDNKHYLGDRFSLSYASSEENWRMIAGRVRTSNHHSARAWIVGNPQLPDSINVCDLILKFQPIQGSQKEAREIYDLFGEGRATLFLNENADRLRLDAWHSEFSVIHLATHGFACPEDPLSSLIVLSALDPEMAQFSDNRSKVVVGSDTSYAVTIDGKVPSGVPPSLETLSDGMYYPGYLDARTIIRKYSLNADLVTLSACQTGLGKFLSQGTIGLSRAFLRAGARSVLVSLWNVDDQSTKMLMTEFYKAYLTHGNKALALRRAMSTTRAQHPHPKYWAAFTLVGMHE